MHGVTEQSRRSEKGVRSMKSVATAGQRKWKERERIQRTNMHTHTCEWCGKIKIGNGGHTYTYPQQPFILAKLEIAIKCQLNKNVYERWKEASCCQQEIR